MNNKKHSTQEKIEWTILYKLVSYLKHLEKEYMKDNCIQVTPQIELSDKDNGIRLANIGCLGLTKHLLDKIKQWEKDYE